MKHNKLIAEFMELPTELFKSGKLNYKYNDGLNYQHSDAWFEEHELSYNVSWDWLIPVAQRLIDVYISIDEQDEQDLQQSILYNRVGVVYIMVAELIKLYNNES